jgi:hypothetical protein
MSISKQGWLAGVVASWTLASAGFAADDVAATVAERLRDSGRLSGYRVNVKGHEGTIFLEGEVSTARELAAAVAVAESTPGVEKVVNRLSMRKSDLGLPVKFTLPDSMRAMFGGQKPPADISRAVPQPSAPPAAEGEIRLTQATEQSATQAAGSQVRRARPRGNRPLPLAAAGGRPIRRGPPPRGVAASGYVGGEHVVPGSERVIGDSGPGGGMGEYVEGRVVEGPYDGGLGQPRPMGTAGVGMPPVPMRGDGPNMPNYAWPSYASYPNYAALQYPTQYSPTAWPYIGPFYPYPQVPLGWRKVSLEWDDGWWFLDFDDRHGH